MHVGMISVYWGNSGGAALRHEDGEPRELFLGHAVRQLELSALLRGHLPVIEYGGDDVVAIVLGLLVVVGQRGVVLAMHQS
jgi:hypothetical protein